MTATSNAFERNLRELGPDGFAQWLLDSFNRETPQPVAGWFQSDDDVAFHEVFAAASLNFDDEAKKIACKGVLSALQNLDQKRIPYYGIVEIFGASEFLDILEKNDQLARILHGKLGPSLRTDEQLFSRDAVLDLRDILETAFRDMVRSAARPKKYLERFTRLSGWCSAILQMPRPSRAFIPALAPIYAISLFQSGRGETIHWQDSWKLIEASFLTQQDQNSELFFYSCGQPERAYAYDIDGLRRMSSELRYLLSSGRVMPKLVATGDPFASESSSATFGVLVPALTSQSESEKQQELVEIGY
jgi:hypothetical protein